MSSTYTIGLLGFGRIGQAIYDQIRGNPDFELDYALVRTRKTELPNEKQLTDTSRLTERSVDLCVEVATPDVVAQLGPSVLEASDLMILSGSALAESTVEKRLRETATENGTDVYLPHAALLGIDGLVDAQDALTEVSIETTKRPADIDSSFTDGFSTEDLSEPMELYDGSVRELCRRVPRNFNSHAVVALASLGLDSTRSTLIADPAADGSTHVITASGNQFSLEIRRQSAIGNVDGNYTHVTVWNSIRRTLNDDGTLKFV